MDDGAIRVAVVVPEIAREGDAEITVDRWRVKVGQAVEVGATVAEVTCDKADIDVVATASGVLVEVQRKAGDVVASGETLGWIDRGATPWVVPVVIPPGAIGRCGFCTALLFVGDVRCRNCGGLA